MKYRRFLAISALLSVLLSLPAFAQQPGTSPNSQTRNDPPPVAKAPARDLKSAQASSDLETDFAEALTIIQDNYIEGNKLDYNQVFKASINGMLRSLDPHSNYFDRAEYSEFLTDQRSEYFGIGSTVGARRVGDSYDTYVLATFQNSPASRAGLRFGDRIIAVDGESVRGKATNDVSDKLRGPRGSVVKVTVERADTGQPATYEITRDAVPQPSIPEAYMIRPGVGYVAMTGGFNLTTGDEFQAALNELHAKGMTTLILDLRGNGGGLVSQAIRVANTFLQRGQLILTQKGRVRGSNYTYTADNETPDKTPLVVLVNRGTASASEIVAGALQDHDRALIVGETSFGKGLVQAPIPLNYGGALLLTYAKYYTPSGRLIQRDYSNGALYDYYTRGGSTRQEKDQEPQKPTGPESRTDTGRAVYGGGGIAPDETVRPRLITASQQRFIDPSFAFVRDLVNGRIAGFDAYKVQRPIEFGYDLKTTDFPATDELYAAFKNFVARNPAYKLTPAQLERNRDYVKRQLRYDIAMSAYGVTTAVQVFNADDPQIGRGIELLPRARELAQMAMRARNPS
jgi:carboxyl-terminal processing protease